MKKNINTENLFSAISQSMEIQLDSLSNAIGFNYWSFQQYKHFIQWGKIWEIGSGLGNMSNFLLPADFVCLTEYEDGYRTRLAKKFENIKNVKVEQVDLTKLDVEHFRAYDFDTIISTNVLEHVGDDVAAVKSVTATMKCDAVLITLVPAHPVLYGSLDKQIGHYRRYTKRSLRKALEAGGQELISIKYFNRISAIGWFMKYKILRSSRISENDVGMVEKLLPIMKLEKFIPLPFGLSIVAVSRCRRR